MATMKIRLDTQAQDGTLTNAKVSASAGIELSKLEAVASGFIVIGNGGGVATAVDVTGDIDISIAGLTSINPGVIVDADINGSAGILLSKLAEAVIQADGGQAFTADQSIGGFKLTNLGTPTASTDAANKSYVDGVASGLDTKGSVRASTTAVLPSGTYDNGTAGVGATITGAVNAALAAQDGITLVADERLLVKDQDFAHQNGIYTLSTVGDGSNAYVLTRATDADQDAEVTANMFVFVSEGTANEDTGWVVTTNDAITVGVTDLDWTQFSAAVAIVAGAGITDNSSTFDIVAADASMTINANDIAVALDGVGTIAVGGTGLQIADATAGEILIGKGGGSDTDFTAITGDITLSSGGLTAFNGAVIVNADVNASAAIDYSKLATLTSGNILVGSAGAVATSITMSGDATIIADGTVTVASDIVKDADVVTREDTGDAVNSSNAVFTLANTPVVGSEEVYLNGLQQDEGGANDYQIAGAVITFNAAPDTGSIVRITYRK